MDFEIELTPSSLYGIESFGKLVLCNFAHFRVDQIVSSSDGLFVQMLDDANKSI